MGLSTIFSLYQIILAIFCVFIYQHINEAQVLDTDEPHACNFETGGTTDFICKSDHLCIEEVHRCDGKVNCDDASDEENCRFASCETDQDLYKCKHGHRCVSRYFLCDGTNDCGDWSDETMCVTFSKAAVNVSCPDTDWKCADGLCISLQWRCNGLLECTDGSDEYDCPEKTTNFTENSSELNSTCHFQCHDKHNSCIPQRWVCDGAPDCPMGLDELPETCGSRQIPEGVLANVSSSECLPSMGLFECRVLNVSGHSCLTSALVCDGTKHCSDGSDEKYCHVCNAESVCSVDPNTKCIPSSLDGTASCYCSKGYVRNEERKLCYDVNECKDFEVSGICSQKCTNIEGSFVCSCIDGYTLSSNATNATSGLCVARQDDPLLIYSTKSKVLGLYLQRNIYEYFTEAKHVIGVAFDSLRQRVLWSDVGLGHEEIVSIDIRANHEREVIVSNGLAVPEDLVVDSVARNVYFSDSHLKHIGVCSLERSDCDIIINNTVVEKPRALSLHLRLRLLVFTEWGSFPRIIKAGMDGSNIEYIVTTDIKWPNGIVVDTILDRIYWSDANLNKVEAMDMDGGRRKVILSEVIDHPFSLALFEDTIYWSDWQSKNIQACNKFTGKDHLIVVEAKPGVTPMGIHIHHPLLDQTGLINPCQTSSRCSHVCLLSPNIKGYTCRCPADWKLNSDGETCIPPKHLPLSSKTSQATLSFISVGSKVYSRIPLGLGKREYQSKQIFDGDANISAMTYNPEGKGSLYIASVEEKRIVELDLTTKVIGFETKGRHVGQPQGLAFDKYANNLYWTDTEHNHIKVLSISTGAIKSLITNLNHPFAIAIINQYSLIVFTELRLFPSVSVVALSGGKGIPSKLKGFSDILKQPVALAVDESNEDVEIYIVDKFTGTIYHYNYDTTLVTRFRERLSRPSSILLSSSKVYWTEEHGGVLFGALKTELASVDAVYDTYEPVGSLIGINVQAEYLVKSHHLTLAPSVLPAFSNTSILNQYESILKTPCLSQSREKVCSHLCFNGPTGILCDCPPNYVLGSNGRNCVEKCLEDSFDCRNDKGQCISKEWVCDGTRDCTNGRDEQNCSIQQNNKNGFGCATSSEWQCRDSLVCIMARWICDGTRDCPNGSDEENCLPTELKCEFMNFNLTKCKDGKQCIPMIYWCDGDIDCADYSDEKNCVAAELQDSRSNSSLDSNSVSSPVVVGYASSSSNLTAPKYTTTIILTVVSIVIIFGGLITIFICRRRRWGRNGDISFEKSILDSPAVCFRHSSSKSLNEKMGSTRGSMVTLEGRAVQSNGFDNPNYAITSLPLSCMDGKTTADDMETVGGSLVKVMDKLKCKTRTSNYVRSFGNPITMMNDNGSSNLETSTSSSLSSYSGGLQQFTEEDGSDHYHAKENQDKVALIP